MRSLIIIATLLLLLTLNASASAEPAGQTVSGSFKCDIEFIDGLLEATNCKVCKVFNIKIK